MLTPKYISGKVSVIGRLWPLLKEVDHMTYIEFRAEYIATLKQFLECKSPTYAFRIDSAESNALAEKLADLEEAQPDWVTRIEDCLADSQLLQ